MSRVTSLVFGAVALGVTLSAAGCQAEIQATFKPKTRFIRTEVREDADSWAGQSISIDIAGVGFAQNGGVSVIADPNATKVTATARLLALAAAEEKSNADLTIDEVKSTFTLTNDGTSIKIACGHGGTHGSSVSGESGCEKVDIVVPVGDASQDRTLDLKVLSGNGQLTLQLASAALKNVGANSNGGNIEADVPATQGATISLVSEKADDITVKLPSDFAADEIILQADEDKISVGSFDDVKIGAGQGGRGPAGVGLASLKLTSKEFAGSTGAITLR